MIFISVTKMPAIQNTSEWAKFHLMETKLKEHYQCL